jgi:alcohol dehydrogenase class IV
MPDVLFHVPTRVVFGPDTINRIGQLVSEYGERVLLVTEAILYEGKVINKVQELLDKKGTPYIVFDEVVPNATSKTAEEGVILARGAHADTVVGLGGIKTLSIAKAIAMTASSRSDIDDFLSGEQPEAEPLAYIEIPTTCRNPLMFVDEYLLADARDRTARIGRAQKGITKAVLMDPKLSLGLPAKYTATTLMDTLLGCVEGLLSSKSNLLSDTFLFKAVEIIGGVVREGLQDSDEVRMRTHASTAGLLLGLGLSMSKPGIGTALAFSINARFFAPKSWVSTILLPYVLEFALNARGDRVTEIARLLGEETEGLAAAEAPGRAVEAVRRIIASLSLPTRLREFDLGLDEMIEIAGVARALDMMNYLPRVVTTEDIYEMIRTAF